MVSSFPLITKPDIDHPARFTQRVHLSFPIFHLQVSTESGIVLRISIPCLDEILFRESERNVLRFAKEPHQGTPCCEIIADNIGQRLLLDSGIAGP
ncbi:MAG: hypothetical protein AUJ57_08070 [Zetaproteobacteria bacterium CG1_02_53_45]|nr:MAG: hypothetical protein AUJ57_08070 [Zetaproteobacteria bacterium CG1_02_53_45]